MRIVGKAQLKVDGPKLARGEKAFVEDMVEPNSCYLKMLRSPHAHAYIRDIDASQAAKIPGVVTILTYKIARKFTIPRPARDFRSLRLMIEN